MPRLRLGPGLLVTAAFIGPGTITTASKAGASHGSTLVWTLAVAVIATLVLQQMAARLGLVTRAGLGQAIRQTVTHPVLRAVACLLVVAAIGFGNSAYQTGNITGAAIGLETLLPWPVWIWSLLVGGAALLILATGTYRVIERVLIALVVLMSLMFVATAVLVGPNPSEWLGSLLRPSLPSGSELLAIGLIGTTVVPYNLFLHASSVCEKWPESVPREQALAESRIDTAMAVLLGGLVTLAVMMTAARLEGSSPIRSAAAMAVQLEPLLGGPTARIAIGVGLFAAGLTSAVTAPLAAAYALAGVLGWPADLSSWRFRTVWLIVLLSGTLLAARLGHSPTETILAAQVANGLLLPLVAVFLLVTVNQTQLLGEHTNGLASNLVGGAVVLFATLLGAYKIAQQLGLAA